MAGRTALGPLDQCERARRASRHRVGGDRGGSIAGVASAPNTAAIAGDLLDGHRDVPGRRRSEGRGRRQAARPTILPRAADRAGRRVARVAALGQRSDRHIAARARGAAGVRRSHATVARAKTDALGGPADAAERGCEHLDGLDARILPGSGGIGVPAVPPLPPPGKTLPPEPPWATSATSTRLFPNAVPDERLTASPPFPPAATGANRNATPATAERAEAGLPGTQSGAPADPDALAIAGGRSRGIDLGVATLSRWGSAPCDSAPGPALA